MWRPLVVLGLLGCVEEVVQGLPVPGPRPEAAPVGEWRLPGICLAAAPSDGPEFQVCGRSDSLVTREDVYTRLQVAEDGTYTLRCVREVLFRGDLHVSCLPIDDCAGLAEHWGLSALDCRAERECWCSGVVHRETVSAGEWAAEEGVVTLTADGQQIQLNAAPSTLTHEAGVFRPAACDQPVAIPVDVEPPPFGRAARDIGLRPIPEGFVAVLPGARRVHLDPAGRMVGGPESLSEWPVREHILLAEDVVVWSDETPDFKRVVLWRAGFPPLVLGTGRGINGLAGISTDAGFEVLWSTMEGVFRVTLDQDGEPVGEAAVDPWDGFESPASIAVGWDGDLGLLAGDNRVQNSASAVFGAPQFWLGDGRIAAADGRNVFAALYHGSGGRRPDLTLEIRDQTSGELNARVRVAQPGLFTGGQAIHEEAQSLRLFWGDDRDARSVGHQDEWGRPREIYTQRFNVLGEPTTQPQRLSFSSADGQRGVHLLASVQTPAGYAMLRHRDSVGLEFALVPWDCLDR